MFIRQASLRVRSLGLANEAVKSQLRHLGTTESVSEATTSQNTIIPESADVVIIGGGSAGCNTLYQLSKRGVNAVLLEKAKITAGTTWHTAGLIWCLRPNDVEIELLRMTREVLSDLEAETGLDPGWINNGGLYIAHNKERLDEYRRLATVGKSFNVESFILDPEETKKVFPLLDASIISGGLYSPGDGVVDPAMLCAALNKASTKAGAKIIENCPVNHIQTGRNIFGSKQVTGVITPYGMIKTNCVVNCSGVWSREVAAMVGLQIPLVPMKHAYVITESMEGVKGLPNVRDHDASMYFRIQGESLCLGGYEPNPIILDKVPLDFEFSLYELDWIVFSTHMQGAVNLVPSFETAGIKTTICGPESFTPDHKPLMGEDPRLFGLYHGCGFNSAGMMLGGGCGRQLAKWIINGRPDLAMFNYDIRRFTPEQCTNMVWISERSHESYVKNYSIVFPHDEPMAGRNLHQDPFHEDFIEAGAVMEERQGWERPGWFSTQGPVSVPTYDWYGAYGTSRHTNCKYSEMLKKDYTFGFPKHHNLIGEESLACREQVALFDMSYFGKMYLSGPEAQQAADYLFTANTRQPIGKTVYTCLLNDRAGVEGDVTVSAIETGTGGQAEPIFKGRGFYIVTGGASAYHVWAHIQSALSQKAFKVKLTDLIDKIGVLSIQGPNSRALLQSLVECDLRDEAFPFSSTRLVTVAGHLCRAIRLSFVGELGWELHVPWDSCQAVLKAVTEQGKKFGLRNAGYRALYSLSSEKGYHLWHADLRSDDNPIEAGLSFTCRTDGNYLGKDTLNAAKKKRVQKKLAFFQLEEEVPVWGLETIWRDDRVVGYLRRGEYGFALGSSIGQGYIRHSEGKGVTTEYLKSGKYQIEIMGHRYNATLHTRSPFDSHGKRLMGNYEDPIPIRQ